MKKLKLKTLEIGDAEVLTREQLKNVFGGQSCTMTYQNSSGSWVTETGTCSYAWQGQQAAYSFYLVAAWYCGTSSFNGPVELSSNNGHRRCGPQ